MDNLGAWPLSEVVPIVSRAQRLGKPVAFVGTGTESLQQSRSRQLVHDSLADYVAHWSVRSTRDRARLLDYGVKPDRITVAADLAWLLAPVNATFGEKTLQRYGLNNQRLIGVNVNAELALVAKEPKLFQKLATLLDKLIQSHEVRVVFLCNEIREDETYDKAAAALVQSYMQRKNEAFVLPNDYLTPQQMLSIVASCRLTLSTRYHFCLFSALQNVPFLAIRRSDKVADLCDDLSWPFGATPGSVEIEDLGRQAATLLGSDCQEARDLPVRVETMRERAWRNQVALDALDACASTASRFKSLRVAIDLYARQKAIDRLPGKWRA